mmetsp:Transcript_11029/g.32133  ORF Transcript_11029/g.32133 Transcript_11029/m.32133 type:complete len:221 (-) Transcript_11029:15-677(-)
MAGHACRHTSHAVGSLSACSSLCSRCRPRVLPTTMLLHNGNHAPCVYKRSLVSPRTKHAMNGTAYRAGAKWVCSIIATVLFAGSLCGLICLRVVGSHIIWCLSVITYLLICVQTSLAGWATTVKAIEAWSARRSPGLPPPPPSRRPIGPRQTRRRRSSPRAQASTSPRSQVLESRGPCYRPEAEPGQLHDSSPPLHTSIDALIMLGRSNNKQEHRKQGYQ